MKPTILLLSLVLTSTQAPTVLRSDFDRLAKGALEAQRIAKDYRARLETCEEVKRIDEQTEELKRDMGEVRKQSEPGKASDLQPLVLGGMIGLGLGVVTGVVLGVWFGVQVQR